MGSHGESVAMNCDSTLPVSPTGKSLTTAEFSLCVHAILEFDQPIDVYHAKQAIRDILLPQNPRFSCIMTKDDKGVAKWKKVEVDVNDHVFVPDFPPGLEDYTEYVNDYISDMHLRRLPPSRPLWEFHFLNYKTSTASATVIINLHHTLGDGASLMSLMLACSTSADNCSRPTSECTQLLPESQKSQIHWFTVHNICQRLFIVVLITWYTLLDFISTLFRLKWLDDSELPIRGAPGVEWMPKVMASATFAMEDVQHIKNSVGGTVNDVIMGVVFYGLQRYLRITLDEKSVGAVEKLRLTALVLMNTRARSGSKTVKPNSEAAWGNRFGYLHVGIPMEKLDNPLDMLGKVKENLDRKKMSFAIFIMGKVLGYVTKLKGPQATAKCMYKTLVNTTLAVTNMAGPGEQISLAGNKVKTLYFSVSGVPQALLVTSTTYMGSLRVQVIAAKGYVDATLLSRCFAHCFQEMKEAARI